MASSDILYNFDNPIFKKHFIYKRFAQEHQDLSEIDNPAIDVKVSRTFGPLSIPNKYEITYHCKSIVGIDAEQRPIYGNNHLVEVSLPKKYPLESATIYTLSPVWHPNIQFHGKAKGRICGNTTNFGKGFSIRQLVFLILDILLYKNYHAEHTPPYPEDRIVASWATDFAEPNKIIQQGIGIIDDADPKEVEPITETKSATLSSPIKIKGNSKKIKFKN